MQRRHARPNVSTIAVFFPPQFPPLGAAERVGSIIPEEAVPNVVYYRHQAPYDFRSAKSAGSEGVASGSESRINGK